MYHGEKAYTQLKNISQTAKGAYTHSTPPPSTHTHIHIFNLLTLYLLDLT